MQLSVCQRKIRIGADGFDHIVAIFVGIIGKFIFQSAFYATRQCRIVVTERGLLDNLMEKSRKD